MNSKDVVSPVVQKDLLYIIIFPNIISYTIYPRISVNFSKECHFYFLEHQWNILGLVRYNEALS